MKSVKTKIIFLVLCCIILTSTTIGGASILNSRRVVSDDSTQIMNLLCANRAGEINASFRAIEQSVKTLSVYATREIESVQRMQTDSAYIESYCANLLDIAVNAAQNTQGALTVYIRLNPEFAGPKAGIFCGKNAQNGGFEPLAPTDLSIYDSEDTAHVGWFYEPVKKKTGTWLAPYFNENIQVEMLSYVIPFYIGPTLIGVVGMDIDYAMLKEIVSSTNIYRSGYAFLTDDQAKIVYHQDLERGTDLIAYNGSEFKDMAQMLQNGTTNGEGLIRYSYRGEQREAAFTSLLNGMRLVIAAPIHEIDEQANNLIVQIVFAALAIVSVAVVFTVAHTKKLVRPLIELNAAAKKIADGDLSVSIAHRSEDEVGTLAESLRQTAAHLHKYIAYINELAYRDSLTGLKNKTAYLEMVAKMDEMTRLKRPRFAVIVFDINGLKAVNDTRGHDFGDILISNAAKIISRVFQESPLYRIGGDEFVALLENADYEGYSALFDKLSKAIEEYNTAPKNELKISIARGIAIYSEETDLTYSDVFKRADRAMYRNKEKMKDSPFILFGSSDIKSPS